MPTYYKPLRRGVPRGQRYGANPGWGPNPPGGHNGDDYLSQVGEPVFAAGDGVVIFAGQFDSTYADNFGWNLNFGGNMIVLNLDGHEGPYVEYGHLSDIRVKTGDRVRGLQVIAFTGESDGGTGVITGPHLHVGCLPPNFNLNTNTYGRVNPDIYLTEWPDDVGSITPQGTITPMSEEDDMAYSEEDLLRIVEAAVDRWSMNSRRFPENRNLLDQLIQVRADIGAVPGKVLFENRVGGRNLVDQNLHTQNLISGIAPGGEVDVPGLAKALAEQLPQADAEALVDALAARLVK
jgi:murein DD-endopeptidase MepM/ murein hydrolase activator NlpD